MVPSDISGWSSQNGAGQLDMISCHDSRKFGPHGGITGVSLKKKYQLPPHWSISISMEAYLLWDWTTAQQFTIKADESVVFQENYSRVTYPDKHFCNGSVFTNSNIDMRLPIGLNYTHSNSELKLEILADTSKDIALQALAIQNLNIHVDSCFYTCKTCSGPSATQCIACPDNSDINADNECLCSVGYTLIDFKCQQEVTCATGMVKNTGIRSCVPKCEVANCEDCVLSKPKVCTKCKSGYKNARGLCYDKCPYYTILMRDQTEERCVDQYSQTLKRPYILTEEFTNKHFSHADIYSNGWVYDDFQTQTRLSQTLSVSSYSANQCDGKQLAAGHGYYHQKVCNPFCSLSRSFTNLLPHFSARVFLQVWAGEQWNNGQFQVYVDGTQLHTQTYQYVDTRPSRDFICGNHLYINDFVFDLNIPKFLHTATTLDISLRWINNQNTKVGWAGFRELGIILELCENSNCKECDSAGDTCISCKGTEGERYSRIFDQNCACPPGYENIVDLEECQLIVCEGEVDELFSRDNTKGCQCPPGYYDARPLHVNCQPCKNPCLTCRESDSQCLSCINDENRHQAPSCLCLKGFFQNQDGRCVQCPAGCLDCSDEFHCQEKVIETKTFVEEYWYIMLLGFVCVILSAFFCFKAYKFQASKTRKVKTEKQKQQEQLQIRINEKKQTLLLQNKLRQKPRNNSYKHNAKSDSKKNTKSWGFKQLDSTKSIDYDARSATKKATFAKTTHNLQEPNSTRSTRQHRRKSFLPAGEAQSAKLITDIPGSETEINSSHVSMNGSHKKRARGKTYAMTDQKSKFAQNYD